MARLDLNMASRPFVNAKPWIVLLVIGALVGAALTFVNAYTLSEALIRRARLKLVLVQHESNLAEVEKARQEAQEALTPVEERRVREVASFVSTLVKGRALSWTNLFNDLESVTPREVRLLNINPDLEGREVEVRMECVAKTNQAKLELFKNLYEPPFDDPYLLGETIDAGQVRFSIRCTYRPTTGRAPEVTLAAEAGP